MKISTRDKPIIITMTPGEKQPAETEGGEEVEEGKHALRRASGVGLGRGRSKIKISTKANPVTILITPGEKQPAQIEGGEEVEGKRG